MSCRKEPGIALDAVAKSNYRSISPGRRLNQRLPAVMEQLMRFQFQAKTTSYRSQFPAAQLVDRSDARLLIVDQVIVLELRNRGIGTAIMHS